MKLWYFVATQLAIALLLGPSHPLSAAQNTSGKVLEVIAEGVGVTADDALKEAFRSAVQQVVGVLVDGQTLVKNDQIISDKLLTASSGFVTRYERLKLDKVGDLVRVRIKARVERTELVDRLREMGITVTRSDPGRVLPKEEDRRFTDAQVQAMTREEATRNKTEILQDALLDLPRVLEARARVPDRFDYTPATSTLAVEVKLQPNQERYVQFLKRLLLRLDKIALKKLYAVADGKAVDVRGWGSGDTDNGVLRGFSASCPPLCGTDLRREPDAWILWVLTDLFNGGASTRWTGYVLDTDPRKSLIGLHGELQVQVTLRDAEGKTITEEIFEPKEHQHRWASFWLGNITHRPKDGSCWWTNPRALLTSPAPEVKITQEQTVNVLIAPVPVKAWWGGQTGSTSIEYVLVRPYPRNIRVAREEVQRIADIRCAVLFRPEKGDK